MHPLLWRALFVIAGTSIFIGGPMHPGGPMAEMLADPRWVPSHALTLEAFVALAIGLVLYKRQVELPPTTRMWHKAAVIGTVLQVIEMVFHTAASMDLENLLAGRATPVLTTHLWMTPIFYPVFAVTIAGFAIAAARDRVLGAPWIAWLAAVGALGHGVAGFLVPLFNVEWARNLFPMIVLVALWAILAGVQPVRRPATTPAAF